MAQVALTREDRNKLVTVAMQRIGYTVEMRRNVLEAAGLDDVVQKLDFQEDAESYTRQLIRVLQERGTLAETGHPALVQLLGWLMGQVQGHEEERTFIEFLLRPYQIAGNAGRRLKIFISYRRKSWGFTLPLAEELRRRLDAEVFVDFQNVDQTDFERSIIQNLIQSDVVLVVVTEYTFDGRIHRADDWVRREISEALTRQKPLVLVGVDGLLPPADLPEEIRDIVRMQVIPFYDRYRDAGVRELVEFLTKVTTAEKVLTDQTTTTLPAVEAESGVMPEPAQAVIKSSATYNEARDAFQKADTAVAERSYAEAIQSYEKAAFLLRHLKQAGFAMRGLTSARLEGLAYEAEQRKLQATRALLMAQEHGEIAELASWYLTRPDAQQAWAEFILDYPDWQASGLAELFPAPSPDKPPPFREDVHTITPTEPRDEPVLTPPSKIKVPTPDQQKLLDIMLNPDIPPPERAEAGRKLAEIGDPRPGVALRDDGIPDINWVLIPDDGEFIYQENQKLRLPPFAISRYPITYQQFQAFVEAEDGFASDQWWHLDRGDLAAQAFPYGNHPRERVTWYQAMAFCRWLTWKVGNEVALPTEEQWEKAARGMDGRIFPWGGDKYISGYANINETYKDDKVGPHYLAQTSAVGIYPQGASPYGVQEMAGNVWEWCLSAYEGEQDISSGAARVLRGGSWDDDSSDARAVYRLWNLPRYRLGNFGFRVVRVVAVPLRHSEIRLSDL